MKSGCQGRVFVDYFDLFLAWKLLPCSTVLFICHLCASGSLAAAVRRETLCQREGDVQGRLHQQCSDQDRGGVVEQSRHAPVVPGQEVINYQPYYFGFILS